MEETKRVEFEFVDELDKDLIEASKTGGIWVDIFREFMANEDAKNVILTFKSTADRASCKNSLRQFKQKYNLDYTYGNYGPGIKLYIVKA